MKQRIVNLLGLISMSLFILSLAIAITINFTPLYEFTIKYLAISETIDMPGDQILINYRVLMNYLNYPWLSELHMPDFPSSESGLFHFMEVKRLFLINYSILIVSGTGLVSFLVYSRRKNLYRRFLTFFKLGILFSLALLSAVIVSFNALFLLFHQTFFNNDAWLFNPVSDPIIRALPSDFFMYNFILVFGLVLIFLVSGHSITKEKMRV